MDIALDGSKHGNMAESTPLGEQRKMNEPERNSVVQEVPTIRMMKRSRQDADALNRSDAEESEPEEKRSSFKLNPPTLIHGQAKPAPKGAALDVAPKKIFLRPSILSAPSIITSTEISTTVSTNGNPVPSITQAPLLGSGLVLPGQVSSNNPFLKTAENEEKEEVPQSTFGALASTNEADTVDNSSADVKTNGGKENPFLQMSSDAKSSEAADDTVAEDSGVGFVFGRKMGERVVQNEADSTSCSDQSDSAGTKAETEEFIFGKNLSERVKVAGAVVDSTNTSLQTAPAESALFQNRNPTDGVSSSTSGKLEENAAALFSASNTKVIMPEVEVKTGEEDEKNVLQIQCKLYQYDCSNSKNWVERGQGNLRLNDKRISATDEFQSRLVMRTNGSLRLILNTKIWAKMVVEKASQKSVRISAQNEEGDIGVYLIMATINDADHIYRAIEYRVLHLKQLQERLEARTSWDYGDAKGVTSSVSSSGRDEPKAEMSEESEDPGEIQVSSSDATPESNGTTTTKNGNQEDEKETQLAVGECNDDAKNSPVEIKSSEVEAVGEASGPAADESKASSGATSMQDDRN